MTPLSVATLGFLDGGSSPALAIAVLGFLGEGGPTPPVVSVATGGPRKIHRHIYIDEEPEPIEEIKREIVREAVQAIYHDMPRTFRGVGRVVVEEAVREATPKFAAAALDIGYNPNHQLLVEAVLRAIAEEQDDEDAMMMMATI